MTPRSLVAVALFPLVAALAGCGGAAPAHQVAAAPPAPAPPPVLTKSLFAKDASGALTESDLQQVLSSPIDLQFPARVGVVPLADPFDPSGKVSLTTRGVASHHLARSLVGERHFSHVSDISTDLPNGGGIEGLRVIAARYRLRYLLLYSERFEDATHLNGWAWLYPTVLGMFVAPGVTVESRGIAQVDLLDVRTGTVLFSVVQPMEVSSQRLMTNAARTHKELQAEAARDSAKKLAKQVSAQTNALIAFADDAASPRRRVETRVLPAPVVAHTEAPVP
jgi:hypothetical protein